MERQYTIIEALGSGAVGTVYRARRDGPDGDSKQVAIKLPSQRLSVADSLAVFAAEARTLDVVRHRAMVKTDGLVRLDGTWALVMECVEGVSLRVVSETGQFPLKAALMTVSVVAGALHTANQSQTSSNASPSGTLHRDIRPEKLLISLSGDVKVLDFGVSLLDDDANSSAHSDCLDYVAPERLSGSEGPESDVYALGAVLYEVLVGERFGRTVDLRSAHDKRLEQAGNNLAGTEAAACVGLRDFILAMLAFNPSHRPTAREVERHFETWATQAPGVGLRDYAELALPALIDQERYRLAVSGQPFLPQGTVLTEESAPNTGPLVQSWTGQTPSSGGMGMVEHSEPATSPIEILRALLSQQDAETVRRTPRTYGPDEAVLATDRWVEDGGMMRYLAGFAGITLLIALGLVAFVLVQMFGGPT